MPSTLGEAYARTLESRKGRGILVTLEGIDGCGKSTQHTLLSKRLEAEGLPVVASREPTEGPYGRRIRALLAKPEAPDRRMAEQLRDLFLADRRDHVEQLISPALAAGKLVLLDRYYHSSMAYQGAAGLDPTRIKAANEAFAPVPDLVIILDVPVATAAQRLEWELAERGGRADGFEARQEYQRRVRGQYLALLGEANVRIINASHEAQVVAGEVWRLMGGLVRGAGRRDVNNFSYM